MKPILWTLTALLAAGVGHADAQTLAATTPPASSGTTALPAATGDSAPQAVPADTMAGSVCCRIPAGTLVELEISEPINSSRHKRGDEFALRLHRPLAVDGTILVAAGSAGVGQVVHADAARGGGKPGELLLAARYLVHGDRQLPLRSLKFGAAGKDNAGVALGVSLAIGPFAHFIRGREIEIPAGTIVNAKLAQDVVLSPSTTIQPALDTPVAIPDPPDASSANQQE